MSCGEENKEGGEEGELKQTGTEKSVVFLEKHSNSQNVFILFRYGDQIIAVKVLNCGNNPEERAALEGRFVREVNMMSRVKHDNLVKFIGACKDPIMVIATELLPGMSLRKYLISIRPKQLDLHVAIGYALDIARAMECLHANGIIHRDLKPDNLLLTANQKFVKLADFGLAREESVTEMMTAETGTYRWMAPELYSTVTLRQGEKKHYNNKVDVYSFGIVLWELLTNRMPFEGMSNLQAAYAAAFKLFRNAKHYTVTWTNPCKFYVGTSSISNSLHPKMKRLTDVRSEYPHMMVTTSQCRMSDACGFLRDCNGTGSWFIRSVYLDPGELLEQQQRPSLPDDIPPDLAFIIQSCWVEDPNVRPSFSQIIRMLNAFLFTVLPPPPPPPEPDRSKVAVPCNAIITESSARARGKFSFLRQLFTTRRTRNT
ncbi:Protein kinase domain [Macleaya cordata]|uniref:Protein kinase domain n=1 Tax=Macleaya cordata TaxID=56857 RepID=A0A200R3K2_MACCD|nr:Protein kinase domain [Macleaya cordata]